MEGKTVSSNEQQTRPQFPALNKYSRFLRAAHESYMLRAGVARFPPIPWWKLLTPYRPDAPVPIDPQRSPAAPVVEASDYPVGKVPVSDPLTLVGYPQPPKDLHVPSPSRTVVDKFGEAEWDKKKFRAFVCPAFVKVEHKAVLTKFGRAQMSQGVVHISRFILEKIGLEPGAGDLFQWGGKLRQVIDAFELYGYIGTSDYWTWIKVPYEDFHGDSSNLELPKLEDIEIPKLPDNQ